MKHLLVWLSVALFAVTFAKAQQSAQSSPLAYLAQGDFNGDGKTDFAQLTSNGQQAQASITTYIGRGDGFISGIKYSAIPASNAFAAFSPLFGEAAAAADFNGDGKLDAAFIVVDNLQNITQAQIWVVLGNGDGTFKSLQQLNVPAQAPFIEQIFIADFNHDNHPDLLIETVHGSSFYANVYLGKGDGTFQAPVTTEVSRFVAGIGDINGDGYSDIAITSSGVSVLLGNGSGGFGTPVVVDSSTTASVLGLQDLNGDGKADLLLGDSVQNGPGSYTYTVTFYPGAASGPFGPPKTAATLTNSSEPGYEGQLIDLNADGIPDLLLNTPLPVIYNSVPYVFQASGNGDGTFGSLGTAPFYTSQLQGNVLAIPFAQNQIALLDSLGNLGFSKSQPGLPINLQEYLLFFNGIAAGSTSNPLAFNFTTTNTDTVSAAAQLPLNVLGQSGSYQVTIAPTANGPFSGNVVLTDNATSKTFNFPVLANVAQPSFHFSPGNLNFQNVHINTTASQTLTVTNVSGSPAYVSQIQMLGSGVSAFTQTNDCSGIITTSCTITMTFAPTKVGAYLADISITDQNAYTSILAVDGYGYSVGPVAAVSPTSISFGNIVIGKTGKAGVTITNTGDAPMLVQSIATAAPFSYNLSAGNSCSYPVQPGRICGAEIDFSPTAQGPQSGTLTIASTGSQNPILVSLQGTGIGPAFSAMPASVNFGNQKVGTATTQQVALTNVSGATAQVSKVTVSGSSTFSETNNCIGSAITSCIVSVTFNPTAAGLVNGALTVYDQNSLATSVSLAGTGYVKGRVFQASATSLNFGNQTVDTSSAALPITITNAGDLPLHIQSISTSAPYTETNNCGALNPGATCAVTTIFSPTATGTFNGALTITDDASNSPQAIALTGTGTAVPAPGLQIAPTSLAFGSEFLGVTSLPQTVTLKNTGNLPVQIQSVTTSGPFGSLNTCDSPIEPGSSCSIGVFFQPTATGSQTGTLTITDNASGSPQTVQLSGTGSTITIAASGGSSTSVTIQQGGTATYNLTVKAEDGYAGSLAVSCAGAPSGMQCTPSASSIALTADAPTANIVFTVKPSTSAAKAVLHGLVSLALLCGIFGAGFRRKGHASGRFLMVLGTCALYITMTACGGGSHKTPPGSTQTQYTLQAVFTTATGEKVQEPLTLIVVKPSGS